jgi:pimeloyl-ACP methyl ester carboxylesterase
VPGPPLLLINGYAATKDDWDPRFVGALAEGFEVVHPEMANAPTVAAMADDVVRLLDRLGIERAAVAGWSMGGMVAQELAARFPERVSALVLLATDGGGPDAVRCTDTVDRALRDRSGTPREQASRLIALLFPPDVAAVIDAQFGDVVADARARLSPAVLDAQEAAMDAWHREPGGERLAAIRAPALIAVGTEDMVIPPANGELLRGGLRDAWLAPFAGGGHAFMAQEPQRLARLIGAFLARDGPA